MADYDLKYTGAQIDGLLDAANELKTNGFIYKGVATPSTNPGTPTERVAYLASEPGTYTNFGGIVITSGLYSLTYASGTWTATQMQAGSDIAVVQTTGQSTSDVMSQKAVTDSLVGTAIAYNNSQSGLEAHNAQGALDELSQSVAKTPHIKISAESNDSNLDIADESGNVILRLEKGHLRTKNFKSESSAQALAANSSADLSIADEEGNAIAQFVNGHIKTKNFDSSDINVEDAQIRTDDFCIDLPHKTIFQYSDANKSVRIPALAVTNNGILLASCETRTSSSDYANNDLLLSRSLDGGETWTEPYILFPYENSKIASCLSFLVNQKTSRVFLFVNRYANSPKWEDTHTMNVLDWDLVYKYSDDDGETWSEETSIKPILDEYGRFSEDIVCMMPGIGHGITMLDGTLVLNIQCKMNTNNTGTTGTKFNIQSGIIYSTDDGASWTLSQSLVPCYSSENEVVEYERGKLAINCRSYIGKRRIFTTNNLGITWTASSADQTIIEPTACQGSFIKLRIGFADCRFLFFNPRSSSARENLTVYEGKTIDSLQPQVHVSHVSQGGYTDMGNFGKSVYCLFEKNTNTLSAATIEFCNLTNFII